MVDPRFFDWGGRIREGMQQSQDNRRKNALLDLDQRQFGLQERQVGLQEQRLAQADAERQAQMQAAQRKESIGLRALAAARGDKQSGMAILQELGLPGELADDPDAGDLFGAIAEQYGGFETPKPQSLGQLYQYEGPQGPQYGTAQQAIGQKPYRPESQGQQPPSGYRWGAGGVLEAIPGGPSDPTGPNSRKGSQPLRKEFRALPSVRDYETTLPIIQSAKKAPDTGYGDLQLIYTVGKLLDPNSVVREGELALTIAAGSPLQRIIGATRFTAEKGGRLPPKSRQQIMEMLNERVASYKQAYDRDFQQYSEYAAEQGYDPSLIVGKHAESAYEKQSGPKPGDIVDGYRFKGGDPSKQQNWVKQ